jgi:hypothetical protein
MLSRMGARPGSGSTTTPVFRTPLGVRDRHDVDGVRLHSID